MIKKERRNLAKKETNIERCDYDGVFQFWDNNKLVVASVQMCLTQVRTDYQERAD